MSRLFSPRPGQRAGLVALLLLLTACPNDRKVTDPPPPERTPTSIRLSETAVTVDDARTVQLSATISDQNGQGFSPPPVATQWSSSNAAVASVSATGMVSGNRPGQAQITATAGTLNASATVTVRPVPTALQAGGGDGQSGPVGGALPQQLVVRVVDRHGEGVADRPVEFVVTSGGGSVSPASVSTDADGYARTTWTLGNTAGANVIEARASGLAGSPVGFQATGVVEAPAALSKVSGDGQSGPAGAALPQPIVVRVTDARGNGVAGVTVSFGVSSGGSVSPSSVQTGVDGQAQTTWTLGAAAGTQALAAGAASLPSVTFFATATAAVTPGSITVTTQTSGTNPPGSYTVSVDGATGQSIGASATITIPNVQPGTRSVQLSGIPSHCTVTNGANPRQVSVSAGQTAQVAFQVSCTAPPSTGSVQVRTETTGPVPGGNYTVAVAGQSRPIGPNATETIANVPVGTQTVQLSDVPGSCTVGGGASRQVSVTAGQTVQVSFQVTCNGSSTGSLRIITQTVGSDPDPDGYTVQIGSGAAQPIGINDSRTIENLAPGTFTVRLAGAAAQCSIATPNPRTVTVTAGQVTSTTFGVQCPLRRTEYRGTLSMTIAYHNIYGQYVGSETYVTNTIVVFDQPRAAGGMIETNAKSLTIVPDPPNIALGLGKMHVNSALDTPTQGGLLLQQFWELQYNGPQITGRVIATHQNARNQFNAMKEIAPNFWMEFIYMMAVGTTLTGTLTDNSVTLDFEGNEVGLTRPFTARITATRVP